MGMSECSPEGGGGSVEMLQSVISGAGDVGGWRSSRGTSEFSCKGGSDFGLVLSMSFPRGLGDSNVEEGVGSMVGVVLINKEAGVV